MSQNMFYVLDQTSADVVCKYRILELQDVSITRSNAFANGHNNVIVQRKFRLMGMRLWFGLKYFKTVDEAKDFLYAKNLTRIERRKVALTPTQSHGPEGEANRED